MITSTLLSLNLASLLNYILTKQHLRARITFPVDTGRKLNVHKSSECTFNLPPLKT